MTETQKGRGEWIWTAGGAAIVDHDGNVTQIAILAAQLLADDESIERAESALKSVARRMELFQPSDIANDGAELLARVEEAIVGWRSGERREPDELPGKTRAKMRRKWPQKP